MNIKWFKAKQTHPTIAVNIVCISVAIILAVHGLHGALSSDSMTKFGEYLTSLGFPFGFFLVWAIVIIQIACSVALIFRRLVVPACFGHMVILIAGIILIHFKNGWFTVGPGRGGMEFSLLLLACLCAVLYAYWPRKL